MVAKCFYTLDMEREFIYNPNYINRNIRCVKRIELIRHLAFTCLNQGQSKD